MPVKARPAVQAAWDWTGFYLGGHAGYGWGRDPRSDAIFGEKVVEIGALPAGIDSRGFVAGFQAGANWQTGAWVSGLEIDLSGTGIKGSTTTVAPDGSETLTITDKFDLLGSARVRLGYLAWPNVLLYGTGGLAWTRFVQEDVTASGTGSSGGTDADLGVWLGRRCRWRSPAVGQQLAPARRISALRLWRFRQLFRNLLLRRSKRHHATSTTGRLTTDVVRAGLSYKFD